MRVDTAPRPLGRLSYSEPHPQTVNDSSENNLAKTGGTRLTPYVLAGGAILVTTGAGAMALTRRRNQNHA
ncbi:LAETG motif-containing sortase-dependent surface protein [Streptomyces viridochromogenes]|uniref:Putative LPXTG-motif cell wall anchor domain protein (Precursor) n=1 Tax=Streptomyces viridochromogenes Tue57 TaxID=1160705 RepID=L8PLA1_STRVR|nr:putative LPXTG-motif cell wall anchor domain protein (Precursor) [Streptomyces viridochromogenes Tue57]